MKGSSLTPLKHKIQAVEDTIINKTINTNTKVLSSQFIKANKCKLSLKLQIVWPDR